MSKKFRQCKNFLKRIGDREKMTFGDYKKGVHLGQKIEKKRRKDFLKAKSMLRPGRKGVVVGNAFYYWEEDKKIIVTLKPNFNGIKRVTEMLKKEEEEEE